jgi:membrane protein YdbS with pleckstrin-like domain
MEPQRVDPAIITVWRFEALLTVAVLSAFGVLFSLVRLPGEVLGLMLLAALIAIIAAWAIPAAQYGALDYEVDDAGITIRSGVVWRSHVRLPRVRIQHTDVSQGPLQRRFGVATLKLYTAGSRYTRIDLPGLAHGEALALRDALIVRAGAGSGV